MRILPPEPDVGEFDGFDPKLDLFKRAEIGAGLTHLVTNVEDPTVIAIDANWGSGKTVFLKMWAGELRKLDVPVIYFDAFANDYAEDAFTALAAEVIGLAKRSGNEGDASVIKFTEKAVDVGKIIFKVGAKLAVKAATLGALDADDAEGIVKSISEDAADEASSLTSRYVEGLLQSSEQQKSAIDEFKAALSSLPGVLSKVEGHPLVVIVDELDRCIPPFALSILERIKHVMSVPNVHFVLGVHVGQLCNSICAVYGEGIAARAYLQKFVHVTVPLVDLAEHENESVVRKYVEYLGSTMLNANRGDAKEAIAQLVIDYALRNDLSLRALQRVYTTVSLGLAVAPQQVLSSIIAGLSILKLEHPHLYVKAKRGQLTYGEINAIFGFGGENLVWHENWWRFVSDERVDQHTIIELSSAIAGSHISRLRLLPHYANNVLDRFQPR